jgi:predicted amidophosphoribosyltransferase
VRVSTAGAGRGSSFGGVLGQLVGDLAAALLPARCPGCGVRAEPVCPRCARTLRLPPPVPPPPPIARWRAAWAYEGVAREVVARLKYRNARHVVPFVADAMVDALGCLDDSVDAVVPVPTTPARARQRGFDHATVLASAVARRIGRPLAEPLTRLPGPPQTGRPAAQRRRGPALRARAVPAGTVLLVDDVATTGATLASAAAVLVAGGAAPPLALVAARTPPRP